VEIKIIYNQIGLKFINLKFYLLIYSNFISVYFWKNNINQLKEKWQMTESWKCIHNKNDVIIVIINFY